MEEIDTQQSNLSISHGDDAADLKSHSLSAMLERAASFSTGIMAIASDNHRSPDFVSYSHLKTNAQSILGGLRQRGLQPGDKVILYLQDPQNFFACIWGCWLGGFVPTPMGVELSFQRAKIERVQSSTSGIVISDLHWDISTVQVEDLLASQPEDNYYDLQLEDLALLLFTSGSTGKPKGVMLSASNLLASVDGMARVNDLSQSDICLNWMPVEHIASLVMFHLTQVYLGCEQIQVKSEIILKNPLTWLDLIDQHRVTATWSPNFAYNLVNKKLLQIRETQPSQQSSQQWNLSCLRWMGNGAEAVVGKTTQRFLELLAPYGLKPNVVSPGYGMSETTSGISHNNQFDRNLNGDWVSVGKPIPGISLRIVDQSDHLVPEKTIGLLQVKGKTVTKGYYQQPKLNQEVFTKDGWFKTGDLGFLSAGRLTITGRQQETIVINGVNYYNHEIETVVEAIASVTVSYTAACGVKDIQQQEQVAIFFNTDRQTDKLRELINQIRKAVFAQVGVSPRYIIPVTPETIPKTAIGKIQRSQLAKRFAAGEFTKVIAAVNELFNNRSLSQEELANNATEQKLVAIWQEVLKLSTVGVEDNFFELGGNSLLLMQVLDQLTTEYDLSAVDLFQYPTIAALASYLNYQSESVARQQGRQRGLRRKQIVNQDVAIIGMSCRFPGANNLEQFWDNLCHGVESISFFEDEEILNAGVKRDLLNHPDYVKASPILEQIENFDAEFWGYSPKEAQLLDPQQRLFMECAWESLEDAGYDPLSYQGDISLYGGAATNTYLLNNIYPHRHHLDQQNDLQVINLSSMGGFQVSTANDKDYLTTRTSYKLNLKGSSVNVQTACSTSLVTVHLACQSLINSECELALAGGVSVHSPQKMGYLHQEGMILSADGHCKAFDAEASGTIFGSGAGMVVLKLLDRAIADGDRIYSVIKGTAVNNDGGTKVGYFAPNLDGQTRVAAEALAYADIPPESIGYIEAHGTGTKLGDPIEIKALSQAYHYDLKNDLKETAPCAVGSVKTNVGHLQMASGIVGLIKTVLCLDRQKIVPTLHFSRPNPQLNLDRSPFYINTQLQDWHRHDFPRRAGVNSLGIGGTNAHVILEEYARVEDKLEPELPAYLLTLSAKNTAALKDTVNNYLDYLASLDESSIRNICFTSNVGRHHFDCRLGIVASNKQELIEALQGSAVNQIKTNQIKTNKVAWLFTGQGSQYLGMAQQLYDTCAVFRDNCDRCFEILQINFFRQDLDLDRPEYAQPFLFTIEYSLAQLWLTWVIKPDIMSGHSIGEYVAATIAGVFSLEDALKLISARGELMQSLPENGAMLAVFGKIPQELLELDLKLNNSVRLAADNGSHLVLSGLSLEISEIADQLAAKDIETKRLKVAHGFHSGLMQPIVAEFRKVAETVVYNLPQIPVVSNLTGELATEYIATAGYWSQHILESVQFAKGIKCLDKQKINIFLEIGTKSTLTAIAKDILSSKLDHKLDHKLFLHSLNSNQADWQNVLRTLSQLYIAGLAIDWQTVVQDYHGHKISLPTYPFQRQRYWFDLPKVDAVKHSFKKNIIHPLLGQPLPSPLKQTIFATCLQTDTHVWLKDHVISNEIIFPGTAYLEMAIALGLDRYQSQELFLENISIVAPLKLDANFETIPEIQTIASPQADSWNWEIYSSQADDWQLHCSGKVSALKQVISGEKLEEIQAKFSNQLNVQQHYQACSQKGISYGQSFQSIKQLWAKDHKALGLVELPNHLNSQQYHFHPALFDACLQILFAALPVVQTNTYIPIGVDRLLINSFRDTKVWSYLELKPIGNEQILIADVWLYSETGNLIAKLAGLKSQAVKSHTINQPWHNWLYQPQWLAKPLAASTANITSDLQANIKAGTWLIFADSAGIGNQLARRLQPQSCRLITPTDIADNPAADQIILQQIILQQIIQQQIAGVVYLWSLDQEDINQDNWQSCSYLYNYLYLVQALVQHGDHHGDHPPLWFVTRNAQSVADYQITPGIYQSCLWGMQKAIALEHPELSCIGIDCDFSIDSEADLIFQEICAGENEQVGYRHNQRYVARLANSQDTVGVNGYLPASSPVPKPENYQLTINHPGNLDSLQWQPVARKLPQDHEIAIEVKATGLNFRDVMVALDLYPDETKFLGLECAGIVTQVGKSVTNFQVGDQVIAISDRSFSQYLTVDALLAIPKPISLSYAEAATIPVTFLTAYYTLIHLAQLQPGQKVLIHSAAGGVGLAAIQIAQHIGAEIFATASPPKWELLKALGVTNMMNSRNLNFAEEIISLTNGTGIDVVVNSLAGEFIPKSIAVLNPQGSFLEIGKQGIWSKAEVAKIKPNLNYQVVDLWQITQNNPVLIQQMLSKLLDRFTIGKLKPLPHTIFKSDRETSSPINAFRYMQQGKHQGKIVITADSQAPKSFSNSFSGTYLITGGMGAIGLKVAQWLITKGVSNIVLLGRGEVKPELKDELAKITAQALVKLIKADVSDTDQLSQTLRQIETTLPPLEGVIHCAGVKCDRAITNQDWESFQVVLAPKAQGAWNLHSLTQKYNLECFMMFSSAASLIGSAGQANYCAANAFLDALAHGRRQMGLPGISINWSAWENTGLAADTAVTANLQQQGIGLIEPTLGIQILEQLLVAAPAQIGVIPIDWNIWYSHHQNITPFFEDLIAKKKHSTANPNLANPNLKDQLSAINKPKRKNLITEHICQYLSQILGLKTTEIDLELGFFDLGLDSLTSVELRNKIHSGYDLKLPTTVLFDYGNVNSLADHILLLLFGDNPTPSSQTNQDQNLTTIANLSEAEAADLLLAELDSLDI